jgi:hypothetical protein
MPARKAVAMADRGIGEHGHEGSTDRLLGELIAEVRAVKHNQNNASQKLDSVSRLVEQVKELKEEQGRHHFRIAVLEADKHRREGAVGLEEWFARHWPVTFVLALLAGFIAWANGRVAV